MSISPGAQFDFSGKHVQLPLFMSAREIQASTHPNFPDKNIVQEDGSPRDVQETLRRRRLGLDPQPERRETDDELYERKLQQSRLKVGGPSLEEDVVKHGVQTPVSIEDPRMWKAGPPDSRGYVGADTSRPMVYGGHHRIAVMAHNRPDDLMPVKFEPSVLKASASEAQSGWGN